MKKQYNIISTVISVVLFIASTAQLASAKDHPIEYQLASIELGTRPKVDHPKVANFSKLLKVLDSSFKENKTQIGDMSVKTMQMLKKEKINESLTNIMTGLSEILKTTPIENQSYAEYAAIYLQLRKSGKSHVDAISGIKAMLKALLQE